MSWDYQSQQSGSLCFGQSANLGRSAILVVSSEWLSLAAASGTPVLKPPSSSGP